MSDLIEWLTAILDEDERKALDISDAQKPYEGPDIRLDLRTTNGDTTTIRHLVIYRAGDALADVAAKRQIIELHPVCNSNIGTPSWCGHCQDSLPVHFPCPTIRALASAYAHRPGYRTEWRPEQ